MNYCGILYIVDHTFPNEFILSVCCLVKPIQSLLNSDRSHRQYLSSLIVCGRSSFVAIALESDNINLPTKHVLSTQQATMKCCLTHTNHVSIDWTAQQRQQQQQQQQQSIIKKKRNTYIKWKEEETSEYIELRLITSKNGVVIRPVFCCSNDFSSRKPIFLRLDKL